MMHNEEILNISCAWLPSVSCMTTTTTTKMRFSLLFPIMATITVKAVKRTWMMKVAMLMPMMMVMMMMTKGRRIDDQSSNNR